MSELKHCPFCGEKHGWEDITDIRFGKNKSICCHGRVLFTAYNKNQHRIITELWNTRPIEDNLIAERDAALARAGTA
ncbi:MAG: hypothetical protein UW63_C0093G0004 [Candidatus Uhrbacteria bacterium GW2011_GWF2_44_350]|uniref:Restriction alleviation protein, Lar family n=1 Tax=Candidatus Uhrbacteria bacterium GW2011_GWF2_44_350 TaxID=1619000 RepID=A0A0G1M7L5_9BACT|nr:MAG: hypothetical protein UW63_C0093G0004 [Candidatus Uhrbacteria bacterium GW2011_GWF2_44_350]